jgi:hypothetical protein
VPTERLELSRLSPPPPQDGVSTNSTTSAIDFAQYTGQLRRKLPEFPPPRAPRPYFGISLVFESASAAGLSGVGAGTAAAGVVAGAVDAGWVAITPLDAPLCA